MEGNIVKDAKLEDLWGHFHIPTKTYPTRADPVTIAAGAAAWNDFSNIVEIIPVNTIASVFHLEFALIDDISATGHYEIKLFKGLGGSEIEICHFGFSRTANQSNEGHHIVRAPHVAANERISAAISSNNAVADTIHLKLEYHESTMLNP
jgi:hypothetical protein